MAIIPLVGAFSNHQTSVGTAKIKLRSYDSMKHGKEQHKMGEY